MKKGFIFTAGLALVLGCGVAVGAHSVGSAKEVGAAPVSTVYCKMTHSWWTTANAAVGAYCWNSEDESQKNAEWPGVRMSAVGGQEGLWTYTIPNGYDKVIFTRMNPSDSGDQYWGSQSDNLDVPSLKNCFTITSETECWGDNHVQGTWSVYPAVAPEYHVLGTFNLWNDASGDYILTVDAEDSNHYTFNDLELTANDELKVCDVKNDDWYGDHGGNVVVPENGTYDIDFYVHADNEINVVATKQTADPVYAYVYKGSAPVALTLDDTDKPEGVVHQYTAEVPYVKRGEEIRFYRDGVEITDHIGVDVVDNNNLYGNTTDGFRFYSTYYYTSGTATIYLKTYSDGGISLWGEGRSELSFTSYLKNGTGGGTMAYLIRDEDYEPNETYIEQYYTPSQYTIKALAGTDWDSSFDLDCAGLTEDVTPEPGATNNARQAFQASAWKVHNDCIENIYLKVKRSDLSLWLYVGGYEEAHVLTIGGQNVPLTKVDEEQYKATGVNLSSGDAVTSYTIDGAPVSVTSKKVANNNLKEDKTILANVNSADIYYNVSDKTLWVSGLPAAGQHLLKNGNTAIEMNHTDPYEGYDQYASGMLTFATNDTIKVLNTGADDSYAVTWCPTIVATSPELAGKFVYDSENQQMKCIEACSAAVYLKIKSGVDEVYFGDVPEYVTEAVDYVNGFKSAMGTACSAEGKKAAVEAAWAAQATAFRALSSQAQGEVKNQSSIVDEIIEFGERYIAIKEQHSDWDLENFLEWDLTPSGRHGFIDNGTDAVGSASIIAIVSVVSVLSISAIIVLVAVKKRKHN